MRTFEYKKSAQTNKQTRQIVDSVLPQWKLTYILKNKNLERMNICEEREREIGTWKMILYEAIGHDI